MNVESAEKLLKGVAQISSTASKKLTKPTGFWQR